ncbi:MAG: sulfotransferase [Sneathiella sp.]
MTERTHAHRKIFLGGYTKSGTTFLGRSFDILDGVYARGEMDYFHFFYDQMNRLGGKYSDNIRIVNREVYDGFGDYKPITNSAAFTLHDKIFLHLYFNGEEVPNDCRYIVEKTPRNIFHFENIKRCFPDCDFITLYRAPQDVFKSLMRHMADHRSAVYRDSNSALRKGMLKNFAKSWNDMTQIIKANRGQMFLIRYESLAADVGGFLDFAQSTILKEQRPLRRPLKSLDKQSYLDSLPEKARSKSLVQVGAGSIRLSEGEIEFIESKCKTIADGFDF